MTRTCQHLRHDGKPCKARVGPGETVCHTHKKYPHPDPAKTPKLWHLPYSKAVEGFYQSEVFVIAVTKEDAKDRVRATVSDWLADPDAGHFRGTAKEPWNDWDDEAEIEAKHAEYMETLEAELDKLVPVEGNAIVRYSI